MRLAAMVRPGRKAPTRKTAFAFVVVVLILLGATALYINALLAPRAFSGTMSLCVPEKASSREVAGLLYRQGLVSHPWVFDLYTRVRGIDGALKPGSYRFTGPMSVPRLASVLVAGPPAVMVTIPGGFTVDQIASTLAAKGVVNRDEFLHEADYGRFDYSFLQGVPYGPGRLEGFLYPDTYRVAVGEKSADVVINLMLRRFEQEETKLDYAAKAAKVGLTVRQAVTVASIVEREAKKDDQRSEVAAVIENRLKLHMPIQSDATVEYALGGHTTTITAADLKVASPYNTYLHTGLPPGPIASPGEASLLAAVEPAHTRDLYFLAKPDGTLVFSTTLAGQLANQRRYLKS